MTAAAPIYGRVALIGLGLIASSMAQAMRAGGLAGHVAGHARTAETRAVALDIGLCDSVHDTAAEAAVRDQDHVNRCRSENARLRSWLAEALAEMGVPSDTSTANFILARFADQAEAAACDNFLKEQGLIVRRVAGYGLPQCLRITVGDEASCRRIAHAVGQFKARR